MPEDLKSWCLSRTQYTYVKS